jgi:hypothetical protein
MYRTFVFPLFKRMGESLTPGYVIMRICESIMMIVGVIIAIMLIPPSQEFIKAGAQNVGACHAMGTVLKQAENGFRSILQRIILGLGGIILTTALYHTKLVPRSNSAVGILGYASLLPTAIPAVYDTVDSTPGGSGSALALPVAIFEIILMPALLFAKGFDTSAFASARATTAPGAVANNLS